MKEIAIYGKGGIGKSTLTSNISAALSLAGKKVLQIGCDPKHDSTRLLTGGLRIKTVLDYIRETGPLDYDLSEVLVHGFNGIDCIEAGGPKPGVGCAGRGIITAFDFLEKFNIKSNYDIILYDVLGDVVCGGFAVPIRNEYSDEIFIVTSGEYMSIYAANNILRGIKNYETKNRVAGLIFNSRNLRNEKARIKAFSEAVGLPVFAEVPRDDSFEKAERENKTVVEQGSSHIADIFFKIASDMTDEHPLYSACPLSDEELEECIMGAEKIQQNDCIAVDGKIRHMGAENAGRLSSTKIETANGRCGQDNQFTYEEGFVEEPVYDGGPLSKNVVREEPLHGCAFNGAVTMGIHLRDAVIVAHSPKSCAYLSYQTISSSGRRALYERGTLLPVSLSPNLTSTDMDESDIVFGGMDKLTEKIDSLIRREDKPRAIIVISSCPAGIIGDDIDKVRSMSTADTAVITIKTDGNLTGDYLQGMLMCYTELANQIIDREARAEDRLVNIVFEKVVSKNTESNFRTIEALLDKLGIRVNCRFLSNTSFDSLRGFNRACLNLLAYRDYTGKILEDFFKSNYGSEFFEYQFPAGFEETERWLRGIGEFFGEIEKAEEIIDESRAEYEKRISEIRPKLEGKSLMIVTYNHNVDWIMRAALDCGMKIVKLGILNFSQDEGFRSELPETDNMDVVDKYDIVGLPADIERLKPDILLTNYESTEMEGEHFTDTIPMCPDVGFYSGLTVVERWSGLMKNNSEGEWQNDGYLVKKYYS